MAQFTSEQLKAALSRYETASNDPSHRLATSAEDVFSQVGRAQERAGTAGHQADHYKMSEDAERGAFVAAGQETRTNPVPLPEQAKPVDLEAATGGQSVVSGLETQSGNEQDPLLQTATHVGHTATEKTVKPPALHEIGDILDGSDEVPPVPERPFAAPWAPPQGSAAVQTEHIGIEDRLAGL